MAGDERLRRVADWTAPGVRLDRFMDSGARLGYEVGEGFPGQAWMSRVPQWRAEIKGDHGLIRLEEGLAEGIRSAAALPLRAAGKPVGVVILVSRTPREAEPGLVRLLDAISGHVTQFLQRREAEGRAAEQAEDLKKLSTVAHELAGQSDHYGARMTLTRAVRDLGAASSVNLWEPTAAGDELEVTASSGAALRGMTRLAGDRLRAGHRVPHGRVRVRGRRDHRPAREVPLARADLRALGRVGARRPGRARRGRAGGELEHPAQRALRARGRAPAAARRPRPRSRSSAPT